MKNENTESKKMILGLLIGGAIGAGVLYTIHAARNHKTPVMKKIGRTISEVGEMLENCNLDSCSDVVESIGEKMPSGSDVFSSLTDWLSHGFALWKTLKKG